MVASKLYVFCTLKPLAESKECPVSQVENDKKYISPGL